MINMNIIATPIILENYKNWVIMRKSAYLNCVRDSRRTELKEREFNPKEIIQKAIETEKILWDFGDWIIVDRRFYDVSKLDQYYL